MEKMFLVFLLYIALCLFLYIYLSIYLSIYLYREFQLTFTLCSITTKSSIKAFCLQLYALKINKQYILFIEVQLTNNIILVSGVQHTDSVLLQIKSYYKIMVIIPCAIQYMLVAYLFYTQQFVSLNPIPLTCPSPLLSPLW